MLSRTSTPVRSCVGVVEGLQAVLLVLSFILDIVVLLGLLAATGAAGHVLLLRAGMIFVSSLQRVLFAIALALAVFLYPIVVLAAPGWLYPPAASGSFALGLITAVVKIPGLGPTFVPVLSRIAMLLVAQLFVLEFIHLVPPLAPPPVCDALTYHPEVPQRYIQAHRYGYIPNGYVNVPQFSGTLYPFAMALHSIRIQSGTTRLVRRFLALSYPATAVLGTAYPVRR